MELLILIIFAITMLYVSITMRIETYVHMLFLQGISLSFLVALRLSSLSIFSTSFLLTETLIFKTILVPWIMMKMVHENAALRELSSKLSSFYCAVITTIIFIFGFGMAHWASGIDNTIRPLYFGVSLSVIMSALFFIVTRRMLVTHVAAYVMLENGIFLLSLSVSQEMPLLINLGVLLDIFVALFIFGIFITHIKSTFDEIDIDKLTTLKG